MNVNEAVQLIPEYLDNELQAVKLQLFTDILKDNKQLQQEVEAYKTSWEMLGCVDLIEPSSTYISNFWTKASIQSKWYENIGAYLAKAIKVPKFALSSVCVVIIVGLLVVNNTKTIIDPAFIQLAANDIELLENMELVEQFDIIEDLEFYENFDLIDQLEVI